MIEVDWTVLEQAAASPVTTIKPNKSLTASKTVEAIEASVFIACGYSVKVGSVSYILASGGVEAESGWMIQATWKTDVVGGS